MSARVSPTDRIRGEIDALFDGQRELAEIIEDVARLGARLIIQTAVQADAVRQVGDEVQRVGIAGDRRFVRGLSTRDVENTLADALGTEAALSKSTVSRVCQAIAGEFTAWSERRLDDLELDYLFLRDAYWTIFDTDDLLTAGLTPGPELVAAVQHRIDTVAEKYARAYPAAVKCLLSDREQLTSYLRFPVEHHKRIRHSNFIERTFGETRRRVKVIGRLPGEASCLNLVWAVLDRASRGWRGMTMTPAGTRLLADLRRQLLDPPTPIRRSQTDAQVTTPESVAAVA